MAINNTLMAINKYVYFKTNCKVLEFVCKAETGEYINCFIFKLQTREEISKNDQA